MILDPYDRGCTIWIGEHVTGIKGSPQEVCEQIYKRIVVPREMIFGKISFDQMYEIEIDVMGIGRVYKDILTDMGLYTKDIKPKSIDTLLPIRTNTIQWHKKLECQYDVIPRFF